MLPDELWELDQACCEHFSDLRTADVLQFRDDLFRLVARYRRIRGSVADDPERLVFVLGDDDEVRYESHGKRYRLRVLCAHLSMFASQHGGSDFNPYVGTHEFSVLSPAPMRFHLSFKNQLGLDNQWFDLRLASMESVG